MKTSDNVFPIEVFPEIFKHLVLECNKSLNFPIDYFATSILVAVSTAIGKSAKLKVKNGWLESASLYACLTGSAGANKSHPLDKAFLPLVLNDRCQTKDFNLFSDIYEAGQILNDQSKILPEDNSKPVVDKTVLNNFTSEVLFQRLADNIRGCVVVSDEIATFFESMKNYSKGDLSSIYLSFWSNKPTSVDRIKNPAPVFITEPFLNIIGTIQPRILAKQFPTGKRDNGFLQRFLFAYPSACYKLPISDEELNEDLVADYTSWLSKYISDMPVTLDSDYKPISKIYKWSTDAKPFFYNWQRDLTEKVNYYGDSLEGEVLNKFDIHFVRLALILQIMADYSVDEISLKSAEAASQLCSYFMETAFNVLERIEKETKEEMLAQNKKDLLQALPLEFDTGVGHEYAEKYNVGERTFSRMLTEKRFFKKLGHGKYQKLS